MKVLIIKIGAIGDVITTLPVIAEVKKRYPASHITWICGQTVLPILKTVPAVDCIVSINEADLFSSNKLSIFKTLMIIYRKIGFSFFNIILNYHADNRYKLISLFTLSAQRLKLLRTTERPIPIPGRTRSDEYVRLFVQYKDNHKISEINFPKIVYEEPLFDRWLLDKTKKTVIICPGGAKNILHEQMMRRWPIEKYSNLAEVLIALNYNVVVCGAASDAWVLDHFNNIPVVNFVGELSLNQTVTLFKSADYVVTHDSGPFHLAVMAQGPQIIGLFGPTNPHEVIYKNNDKIHFIWGGEELACRPCYYGKHFARCTNNLCMQFISVNEVISLINELTIETN